MPAERGGDPHQPPRASPAAPRRPAKTKFSDGGNTSFLSPHAARPAPPARRRTPGLPRPSAHRSGSLTSSSAPREAAARRFAPAPPASPPARSPQVAAGAQLWASYGPGANSATAPPADAPHSHLPGRGRGRARPHGWPLIPTGAGLSPRPHERELKRKNGRETGPSGRVRVGATPPCFPRGHPPGLGAQQPAARCPRAVPGGSPPAGRAAAAAVGGASGLRIAVGGAG